MLPGDQHLPANDKSGQSNPFSPEQIPISRMTAQEIASLQSKLDRQLGPEYISDRPGAGGMKVHYLEAWKCINLANEIFGFNGWSSSIQNIAVDYIDENRETGRVSLGLSVVVRVTLRDGVYHEDIGYGSIDNAKSKAAAFEKCKKEGTTDGLKRALRNFGNVLGNCLYDKTYLREVSKIKPPPPRFDVNVLHRRPEFAPEVKPVVAPPPNNTKVVSAAAPTVQHAALATTTVTKPLPANDDNLFQDQSDDAYFDDYDFEDRPLFIESPRLNEFDANTITPPGVTLHSSKNNQLHDPVPHAQQAGQPQTNAMQLTNKDQIHPGSNLPEPKRIPQQTFAKSDSSGPGTVANTSFNPNLNGHNQPQPPPRPSTPLQSNDTPQGQPPAGNAVFVRVQRDGATGSAYDHKSGNFSPSVYNKSGAGIDYSKSTPIARPRAPKVPLGNNIDAHNRMQPTSLGSNPSHRMVGCPPNSGAKPQMTGTHNRGNSGPTTNGVKRNFQGQPISMQERNIVNGNQIQGQISDAKRLKN